MSLPDYLSVIVGAGGAGFGLWQYLSNKKKEMLTNIVMPLLKEFSELNDAEIAANILDDFGYEIEDQNDEAFKKYGGYISRKDLITILRDHRPKGQETSDEEDNVRKSFDALLFFFAKLEYILNLGLIKKEDLKLFNYFIEKAAREEGVVRFVKIYELALHGDIDPRLDSTHR